MALKWPHRMILEVSWDNLWITSFGLSQFHGHNFWLVCSGPKPCYPMPTLHLMAFSQLRYFFHPI